MNTTYHGLGIPKEIVFAKKKKKMPAKGCGLRSPRHPGHAFAKKSFSLTMSTAARVPHGMNTLTRSGWSQVMLTRPAGRGGG